MQELPYFPLYPKDVLSDGYAMAMPNEVFGIYFKLLFYDWTDDGLVDDDQTLMLLASYSHTNYQGQPREADDYDRVLSHIRKRFIAHPSKEGFITNPRLLAEREKIVGKSKERSKSGKLGAQKRWSKPSKPKRKKRNSIAIKQPLAKNGYSDPDPNSDTDKSISKDILEAYMVRINKLFNRRATTKWKPGEIAELKKVGEIEENDFLILEKYYAFDHPHDNDYRRRALPTFVNNLRAEIDKAKRWKPPVSHADKYQDDQDF